MLEEPYSIGIGQSLGGVEIQSDPNKNHKSIKKLKIAKIK